MTIYTRFSLNRLGARSGTALAISLALLQACSGGSNKTTAATDPAEPVFSPALFDTNSARVDNPYFPLSPGVTAFYAGVNEDGEVETVETAVSHLTRTVNGVESVIVVDREYADGELVEETFDWYAQDIEGNVWYMGEASTEYEDGEAVSTEGSWESGVDVDGIGELGQAGIIMKATPVVGDTYSHEIYPGVAEDGAEVVSLAANFIYIDGRADTALQIREFDPLDPTGGGEYKYYVSGKGLIAEENLDGSERIELNNTTDQSSPVIRLEDFTNPTLIDHPYLPMAPGMVHRYSAMIDGELEEVIVEVTSETRVIMGITARVVKATEFTEGELLEETFDWFAQDDAGNVWYFGEDVTNFEYDDEGNLLSTDNEGAWEAGVGGAHAGIAMPANPRVGDSYRQEYAPGNAEDIGAIEALNISVTLADGANYVTLQTRDWNPLEDPDEFEFKYYAEGVGLVREEEGNGEEQVDLVSFTF